jgi:hypothetical protein
MFCWFYASDDFQKVPEKTTEDIEFLVFYIAKYFRLKLRQQITIPFQYQTVNVLHTTIRKHIRLKTRETS